MMQAVSVGLDVVAARVGGVPEILPPDMIRFAEPNVTDIARVLSQAVTSMTYKKDPWILHRKVKGMYSWADVAERTGTSTR